MAGNREVTPEAAFRLAQEPLPYISILQTERTVIGYGITEDELEHVSGLNTQATTFFSVSSALFVLAVGVVVDWLMEGQPSTYGALLVQFITPILSTYFN